MKGRRTSSAYNALKGTCTCISAQHLLSDCSRAREAARPHRLTRGGRTIKCPAAAAARAAPARCRSAPPHLHSRLHGTALKTAQPPACAATHPCLLPYRCRCRRRVSAESCPQPCSSRRATRARWTLPRGPRAARRAAAQHATRVTRPTACLPSPRAGLCPPLPPGLTHSTRRAARPHSRYRRASGRHARRATRRARHALLHRQIGLRPPSHRLRQ